jgi:hypothetical protein
METDPGPWYEVRCATCSHPAGPDLIAYLQRRTSVTPSGTCEQCGCEAFAFHPHAGPDTPAAADDA